MKDKSKRDRGLYRRRRRWRLKWYVPGVGPQRMPLVLAKATTNLQVARQLATEVRRSGMTAEQMRQRTGRGTRRQQAKPWRGEPAELPANLELLVEEYERYNADRGSARQAWRYAKRIRDLLVDRAIADLRKLRPADVADYLDKLKGDELAPETRRKARSSLSSFCRFCRVRGAMLAGQNPAQAVQDPAKTLPPVRPAPCSRPALLARLFSRGTRLLPGGQLGTSGLLTVGPSPSVRALWRECLP